jgi:hypothetical protein
VNIKNIFRQPKNIGFITSTELPELRSKLQARDRTELEVGLRNQGLPTEAQTQYKALSTDKLDKLGAGSIANVKLIVAGRIMASVPLLAQLNEAQLGTVLKESRIATYEAGDVLIFEGDIGSEQSVVVKYIHCLSYSRKLNYRPAILCASRWRM